MTVPYLILSAVLHFPPSPPFAAVPPNVYRRPSAPSSSYRTRALTCRAPIVTPHCNSHCTQEAKCSFILLPDEGSDMPTLMQSKLNAPRILQVGTEGEGVWEIAEGRGNYRGGGGRGNCVGSPVETPHPLILPSTRPHMSYPSLSSSEHRSARQNPLLPQVHKVASYCPPPCIVLTPIPPAGAQGRLVLPRQAQ